MIISNEIKSLLNSHTIGHLATTSNQNIPRVIPICFIELDSHIYSILDKKPKSIPVNLLARVKNIESNPYVSFIIDYYDEDWKSLWYVQVNGTAQLLYKPKSQVIHKLIHKYPNYENMEIENQPIIKISPTSINKWGERFT